MSNYDDIMGDQEYIGDMMRLSFGLGVRISRRIFYSTSVAPLLEILKWNTSGLLVVNDSCSLTTWGNYDSAPPLADMC